MEEEILFNTALLEELGDKKSTLIVLGFFLDNSPKDITELEKLLADKDLPGVFKKAHKLKGSLAMLKAIKLVDLLEQLENASGVEKNLETSETLTQLFIEKFGLLIIQLDKEVANIKSSLA